MTQQTGRRSKSNFSMKPRDLRTDKRTQKRPFALKDTPGGPVTENYKISSSSKKPNSSYCLISNKRVGPFVKWGNQSFQR